MNKILRPHWLATTIALCCLAWLLPGDVEAHTPMSPVVKKMVLSGIGLLEKAQEKRPGHKALLALAMIKADKKYGTKYKSSAFVQEAAKGCKEINTEDHKAVYGLSIAILLLCELDPRQHRQTIQAMLRELGNKQRSDGSWSYSNRNIGDTSCTQYGVLASWTAHNVGKDGNLFSVNRSSLERACKWLMRTQDVSGAWSYLGKDPGGYNRVPQSQDDPPGQNAGRITPSMVVGAMGSIYMSAQVLGIEDHVTRRPDPKKKKGPLKKVEATKETKKAAASSHSIEMGVLRRSIQDGENFFRQRCQTETNHWQSYYLYGMERHQALREFATRDFEDEPNWYNQGVEFLQRNEKDGGGWSLGGDEEANQGAETDTAFSILFLLRATRDLVKTLQGGKLRGGRGLPADLSNLQVDEDGAVIKVKAVVDLETALLRIKETAKLDEIPRDVKFSEVESERKRQLNRLAKLFADPSYEKRIFAVRGVARGGGLSEVPALIYALSDPDLRVVLAARDGLRLVSRRFAGVGMPDTPSEVQKKQAQTAWKRWYKSVRPDADLEFLE